MTIIFEALAIICGYMETKIKKQYTKERANQYLEVSDFILKKCSNPVRICVGINVVESIKKSINNFK